MVEPGVARFGVLVTCYTVAYFNGARAEATAAADGELVAATFLAGTDEIHPSPQRLSRHGRVHCRL